MGKCGSCGAEVSEKDKFCPICGAKIEDKADGKKVCAACGAELKNEDRFCPACGTRVEEKPTACPKCGAKLEDGDRFCRDCGAAIGGAPVGKRAKSGGGIAAVRDKAVAFEKKNHIFANVLVIMLAIVVLFVSLFAPIKLSATNITNFMSDGMGGSDSSAV
ncbi:MAG: zinc ribbon domain-containing protein [Clostridia bacterium]|nr:zinc ribbon domain-containing protein [Clostridia bacterium]